jgi:integration host factor subunit beta
MSTITKKELIDRIAGATHAKPGMVKPVVQSFLDEVIRELVKGNRLEFRDFGVFETKARPARTARNPKTLEDVQVPAARVVRFKMGRLMKQKLGAATRQESR